MVKRLIPGIFCIFPLVFFILTLNNTFLNKIGNQRISKFEVSYYRAELEYLKTRDPETGVIPANIRESELKFVESLPEQGVNGLLNNNNSSDRKYYTPVIQSYTWESKGPSNIAGRIKDIEFDIKNDQTILAASASGGVWKSYDQGKHWVKTSSPEIEQSVYCLEQDKRFANSNVWYYGSGELLSTTDRKFVTFERTVGMGNGIYKSTDNGESWKILNSTRVMDASSLNDVFQGIWDIETDTTINDQNVIYAACYGAVMKSSDGGESWEPAIGDTKNKCFSTDIEISSTGIYYSALSSLTINGAKPNKTGIFRSNNGSNWTDITPKNFPEETRVIKICLAPSNQNVIYILTETHIDNNEWNGGFAMSNHTFWKYTFDPVKNSGIWDDRTDNIPYQSIENFDYALQNGYNSLGGYCMTLNVHPSDENIVFLGGTNLFRSISGFSDSESTLKIGGYNTSLHPDQHCITFLPSNNLILLDANDGGIASTQNCLSNIIDFKIMNEGLRTTQFYSVSIDRSTENDEFMIGGLQDQGTNLKINTSQDSWKQIFGADGLSSYVGNNKDFLIASVYNGAIYSVYYNEYGNYYFPFQGAIMPDNLDGSQFNFFTIFDVEPNDNDELYIAKKNTILRKSNFKAFVKNINLNNNDWTSLSKSALVKDENITSIRLSTQPANRLYFGSDAGKLYRIDNANIGNPAKINITDDEFPLNGYISCISIDPYDADKVFVIFSNYNVQSIFYSSDGGASWESQGGNLEENPDGAGAGPSIRWLEILHTIDGIVYFAGTSSGLFSTTALAGINTIWVKESPDLIGNIKIDMITVRQSDGFVAVATQGNGIYTSYVKSITGYQESNQHGDLRISNYPNPCYDNTCFDINIPANGIYSLELYNMQGKKINQIFEKYFKEGNYKFNFALNNLISGTYVYIISSKKYKISGKMTIWK